MVGGWLWSCSESLKIVGFEAGGVVGGVGEEIHGLQGDTVGAARGSWMKEVGGEEIQVNEE